MTVGELIAELIRYPADLPVVVDARDNDCHYDHREHPVLTLETLVQVHSAEARVWRGRYEILWEPEAWERRGLALPKCAFLALHLTAPDAPQDDDEDDECLGNCHHSLPSLRM